VGGEQVDHTEDCGPTLLCRGLIDHVIVDAMGTSQGMD
jgi:hypothetical protein